MLRVFSLALLLSSLAFSEINYVKLVYDRKDSLHTSIYCADKDTGTLYRTNTTVDNEGFIPFFIAIKRNTTTTNFLNALGEECKQVTYEADSIAAIATISEKYEQYNDKNIAINYLEGRVADQQEEWPIRDEEFKILVEITDKLEEDWLKIQDDYGLDYDLVYTKTLERNDLLADEKELIQMYAGSEEIIDQKIALTQEKNETKVLLDSVISELTLARNNYIPEEETQISTHVDDALSGVTTGTYSLSEALEDYVEIHQNDIRTSKTLDNTYMDLNYMRINFKETGVLR